MKVRALSYVIIGLVIPWLLGKAINMDILLNAYILLPLIGFTHELLHLVAIKMLGLSHRFIMNGLFIGFHISTDSPRNIVLAASFPQVLNVILFSIYIALNSYLALALFIYHTLLSFEDISKIFKYTLFYDNPQL